MTRIYLILMFLILIIASSLLYFFYFSKNQSKNQPPPSPYLSENAPSTEEPSKLPQPSAEPNEPIQNFKSRITKKPFGIYITPQSSPVQPERFTGYHTAVDVEYQDQSGDIPVYAIEDGTITYSNWVSGYGGVLIMKSQIENKSSSILYGHLKQSSLPTVGTEFKKGDQMAILGEGYSNDTDNERKHLHFGILSDDRIDLKGYVQNKSQLSGWVDPLSLFKK